ncbi:Probable LIM domain-containing serine/threonine-protein kinase DDB [Seminavis robusta]|uniref:Probable LIM domain-containing serine/threonine-protein kinase DDB n=1 Tax=Seminavis robusta TaxID=568900 RepID=A0A9N8EJL9_9STRA|nr:Probable LIM domain-containing serine/threonine-protein kinase DDB [Seminavis robusta]|eukprot:Sro1037_g234220.1 Probable LIM domain-containing serine/threonine-protein kinase DDB (488) ;mRNA; r:36960-38529
MQADEEIEEKGDQNEKSPRSKKKGGIKRFVKKKLRRNFSSSSGGFPSSSGEEDLSPQDTTTTSHKISLQVGEKAVPMAEQRLSEMLKKTRFVRRRNKMLGMLSFQPDAFEVGELVARGGFANVHKLETWLCDCDLNEDENWGKQYVLKSLRADGARTAERLASMASDLMMEAHILSALEHPHVLALRGISTRGLSSLKRGHVDGLFLILDYLPTTLYHKLVEWQNAEEELEETQSTSPSLRDRFQAAIDLASALKYVHSKNIVYRDIKASNVGFDAQGCLKLFDFGLAVEIPRSSDPNRTFQLAGRKGTARYMAPENIKKKPYNAKADVFGMAILTWQMLALSKPFANQTSSDAVLQKISHGDRPPLKFLATNSFQSTTTQPKLEQLLATAWAKSLEDRPTMKVMHARLVQISKGEFGRHDDNDNQNDRKDDSQKTGQEEAYPLTDASVTSADSSSSRSPGENDENDNSKPEHGGEQEDPTETFQYF